MSKNIVYMIWNNKGGVGKTFLTYLLATEYASKNPSKNVCTIDMCPQANLSETILGGSESGNKNLEIIAKEQLTIADYIRMCADNVAFSSEAFFIKSKDYNEKMPDNLYLIAGDVDLDMCSNILQYMAQNPKKGSWKKSRTLLKDLIQSFKSVKETVFFIDCNPSFAPYTELAAIASTHLIVPCTANFSSLKGLNNVCKVLFNDDQSDHKNDYDTFYEKVKENDLSLPRLHFTVLNKSRSHAKSASSAYKATVKELERKVRDISDSMPENITPDKAVVNMKDGNTLAVVLGYQGQLLSNFRAGIYEIFENRAQVDPDQIVLLKKDVEILISSL